MLVLGLSPNDPREVRHGQAGAVQRDAEQEREGPHCVKGAQPLRLAHAAGKVHPAIGEPFRIVGG